jgi:hypothetical protein
VGLGCSPFLSLDCTYTYSKGNEGEMENGPAQYIEIVLALDCIEQKTGSGVFDRGLLEKMLLFQSMKKRNNDDYWVMYRSIQKLRSSQDDLYICGLLFLANGDGLHYYESVCKNYNISGAVEIENYMKIGKIFISVLNSGIQDSTFHFPSSCSQVLTILKISDEFQESPEKVYITLLSILGKEISEKTPSELQQAWSTLYLKSEKNYN